MLIDNRDKIAFRFLVLLVPSLLLTHFYFKNIGGFLTINPEFKPRGGETVDVGPQIQKQLKDKIEGIDIFFKIPNSFLRYKIYAYNNVYFYQSKNKFAGTIMAIDVDGQYKEIKTGERKTFDRFLKTPEEILNVSIIVNFKVPHDLKIGNDLYQFGIKPTTTSFLIVLLSTIVLVHAFYFILYKWYKFVRYFDF